MERKPAAQVERPVCENTVVTLTSKGLRFDNAVSIAVKEEQREDALRRSKGDVAKIEEEDWDWRLTSSTLQLPHPNLPNKPYLVPLFDRRSIKPSSPAPVNAFEEPFMLYRPPPPWASLAHHISSLRSEEKRRRESQKIAIAIRHSEFAAVDRSDHKMAAAKRQLESLVAKRTELRETFGMVSSTSSSAPATSSGALNPFKRRARPAEEPVTGPSKPMLPISRVHAPVFTQELLDATAKENEKAGLGKAREAPEGPSKKQKRALQPAKSQRRQSLPAEPTPTFDWAQWGKR